MERRDTQIERINPTSPSKPVKIYGAGNIKRHLQRKKPVASRDAETSIADGNRHTGKVHAGGRETARRLRQLERATK